MFRIHFIEIALIQNLDNITLYFRQYWVRVETHMNLEHYFVIFQTRAQVIQNFRQQKVARRGILALLLSTDMSFKPFDMKEVSYSVIGPYCLQHNTQVPQVNTIWKYIETVY